VGAAVGGMAGGAAGWLALGAASVAVPVIGPVLAVGALVGALSAAGGAAGWLAGGLASHGLADKEATFYERAVAEGNVLVTVKTDESNVERARTVLRMSNSSEYQVH
ncbi:MAG TPA: hypothetical protein VKU60_16125, partial [Chloroflexota bacterium]|nr:hypothetical protein [Chloroflexota bacterium]